MYPLEINIKALFDIFPAARNEVGQKESGIEKGQGNVQYQLMIIWPWTIFASAESNPDSAGGRLSLRSSPVIVISLPKLHLYR